MIARLAVLALLALPLAGCITTGIGSIVGGECKVFEAPAFAVRGKRQYDQDWIDGNIEAGVGGCGWKRPKARPASLDAKPGQKAVAPPPKKRGLLKRIKDRVTGAKEPVPYLDPGAPPAPPPVVEAKPPPRDPVDELLQPGEPIRRVH